MREPKISDNMIVIHMMKEGFKFIQRINRGVSFCQVNNRPTLIQVNLSTKEGTQKCNGAAPSFVNKAKLTIS